MYSSNSSADVAVSSTLSVVLDVVVGSGSGVYVSSTLDFSTSAPRFVSVVSFKLSTALSAASFESISTFTSKYRPGVFTVNSFESYVSSVTSLTAVMIS
jgi:hypothetical protein